MSNNIYIVVICACMYILMIYFNTTAETFESIIIKYNSLDNTVYHQTHCKTYENQLLPRNFASVLSVAGFTSNHRDVTQSASEDSASVTAVLAVSASLFCDFSAAVLTCAASSGHKMVMARRARRKFSLELSAPDTCTLAFGPSARARATLFW